MCVAFSRRCKENDKGSVGGRGTPVRESTARRAERPRMRKENEENATVADEIKRVDNEFFKDEAFEGMDKLDIIFAMQEKFDQDVIKNRGLQDVTPEQWIQKQTLAMLSELAELIAEVNFKWWKNPKPVDSGNVKEELVDILHCFVGMCNRAGMDSGELFARYIKKNEENFKRQYGTSNKPGYSLFDDKV